MLDQLPTELRLKTLVNLGACDLRSAQLVSRSWRQFFIANESSIYRHAAAVHGFAPSSEVSLADVKSASSPSSMVGVESWKGLIKRRFQIEMNWQGLTQPRVKVFRSSGDAVHRIKIDEEAGYIITTSKDGGLRVTDLYRNEVLWSLRRDYVCQQAHCEYGNGYIIFNRPGNFKEIWRRARDFHTDTPSTAEHSPDENMLKASADAAERYRSNTLRGHFFPYALLELPAFGRAFRFDGKSLLVAAENQAFIWDIFPTVRLSITIHDIQAPIDGAILGRINYVDINDRYVIICGSQQLRIFSKSPQGAFLYHIPASKAIYAKSALDLSAEYEHGAGDTVLAPQIASTYSNDITATPAPLPPALVDVMRFDDFVAAHISPCGSTLAALLSFGRVLIVSSLDRVVNGEVALADAALEVNLHSSRLASSLSSLIQYSTYLAFEERRIAVATRGGIYIITLNNLAHGIISPKEVDTQSQRAASTPIPNLTICQAVCFDNPTALYSLSCLQLTETGLFVTWKPHVPRLSAMLQSPGHQPSLDAPQRFLLINDDGWDVEDNNEDHSDGQRSTGLLSDETMTADDGPTLEFTVDPNGGPSIQLAGPSSVAVPEGEQEESDDSFPDSQSVFDDSSDAGGDDPPQHLRPVSTVVCIDFLPE